MEPECSPFPLDEYVEVTLGLGVRQHAERIVLAGDRQRIRVVAGELQEDAAVGPALVQLPGRVQEARSVAAAGSDPVSVPHGQPDRAQVGLGLPRGVEVGVDREIVAGPQAAEVSRQRLAEARSGRCARVCEELDAVLGQHRLPGGQAALLFVTGHQRASGELRRLDVGLVEGIQAEHGAGDSGRHLPAIELGAEVTLVIHLDPHQRVSGGLEGVDLRVLIRIRRACEPDVREQAVVPVVLRRADGFVPDRDDPGAVLSG